MNRLLLSAAFLSILATGCGRAALEARTGAGLAVAGPASSAREDAAQKQESAPAEAQASEEGRGADRKPGDYVAYRFSGSFRKAPLLLTQRIVAREGDALVIDMTLEGGKRAEALRVRMSDAPGTRGEVLSAAWLDGNAERPATLADYEAMMAKTGLAADANEEVLGSEQVTLQIGGAPLPCERTSYRVRIGNTTATMRTVQSDGFAWGDVGGEITADDGRVLYRAELIDAGHAGEEARPGAKSATVAQSDYED
jgi:hypothetical protein